MFLLISLSDKKICHTDFNPKTTCFVAASNFIRKEICFFVGNIFFVISKRKSSLLSKALISKFFLQLFLISRIFLNHYFSGLLVANQFKHKKITILNMLMIFSPWPNHQSTCLMTKILFSRYEHQDLYELQSIEYI